LWGNTLAHDRRTYGWDFGRGGRLVENATEQRAVAWIRQLHSQSTSLRQIADMLNEKGVEPKRAKKWLHSSVLRIVKRSA
jgi:Recombinase